MSDMRGPCLPRRVGGTHCAAAVLWLTCAAGAATAEGEATSRPAHATSRPAPTSAATSAPAAEQADGKLALRTDRRKPVPTLSDGSATGLLGRTLAYVAVVAVLGAGAVLVAKRYFPRGRASVGRIRVMDSVYLAPRKQLHILEVGGQRFLVASCRDSVSMIAELRGSFSDTYERQMARASAEDADGATQGESQG